jgi:hypothetical protein
METSYPPVAFTASAPTMVAGSSSPPLTRESGSMASMSYAGVSSVKTQTASTIVREASMRAPKPSPFTGLSGPLGLTAGASLLSPTIGMSIRAAALERSSRCPSCRMSKHPFVDMSRLPRNLQPATRRSSSFGPGVFYKCLCEAFTAFPVHNRQQDEAEDAGYQDENGLEGP